MLSTGVRVNIVRGGRPEELDSERMDRGDFSVKQRGGVRKNGEHGRGLFRGSERYTTFRDKVIIFIAGSVNLLCHRDRTNDVQRKLKLVQFSLNGVCYIPRKRAMISQDKEK